MCSPLKVGSLNIMRYFAFLATFLPSALAATYPLTDTFIGNQFLSGFQWQAIGDPTHGRV